MIIDSHGIPPLPLGHNNSLIMIHGHDVLLPRTISVSLRCRTIVERNRNSSETETIAERNRNSSRSIVMMVLAKSSLHSHVDMIGWSFFTLVIVFLYFQVFCLLKFVYFCKL